MIDLVDFILTMGLMDIILNSSIFTWSNRRQGKNLIQVKLDRFLVSNNWENIDSSLCAIPRAGSNHNVILLSLDDSREKKYYPFRYQIIWSHHPNFESLVKHWWKTPTSGTPMYQVTQKLKIIKDKVKGWNGYSFGNIFKQKKKIMENFEIL